MHLPGAGVVCRVHRSSCLRKLLREKTMWFTSTLVLGTAVFCATGERRLSQVPVRYSPNRSRLISAAVG